MRGPVCTGQKTVIRREQPLRNRRMTRRTFQTITQRWKITDISSAGTGKLRLHQLRNSPTAIKNAIKVIRKAMFVCKQTFSDRVASRRSPISASVLASEPRVPYAILNKMVIFFSSTSGPSFRSALQHHRRIGISLCRKFIETSLASRHLGSRINSPALSERCARRACESSLRIFHLFNDRENRPLCGTGVFPPPSCTQNSFHFGSAGMYRNSSISQEITNRP